MKTNFEILKNVADLCATARPKAIEGEWASILNRTLDGLNDLNTRFGLVITEELITLGVMWRWLKRHGQSYEAEFMQYCELIGDDE